MSTTASGQIDSIRSGAAEALTYTCEVLRSNIRDLCDIRARECIEQETHRLLLELVAIRVMIRSLGKMVQGESFNRDTDPLGAACIHQLEAAKESIIEEIM